MSSRAQRSDLSGDCFGAARLAMTGACHREQSEAICRSTTYFLVKISPFRIHRLNQGNLLCARTSLDLFFAADCHVHIVANLEIHKPIYVVLGRESFAESLLMLINPARQMAGHAGAQDAKRSVGEDVDGWGLFHRAGDCFGAARLAMTKSGKNREIASSGFALLAMTPIESSRAQRSDPSGDCFGAMRLAMTATLSSRAQRSDLPKMTLAGKAQGKAREKVDLVSSAGLRNRPFQLRAPA